MQDLGISVLWEGRNLIRLLLGLWITVKIALYSVALSILFGIFLGMIMRIKNRFIRLICQIYLEFIRVMPQLVLLFLVYFGATKAFDIDISGEVAAIFVFTLWGTAEMGDLVRGALESIPKHQYESGQALGLTDGQLYCYVIIPQAVRRLIPVSINLATRMIKTTSLVVLIGVVEVLKVGQQIIEAARYTQPSAALWIYGVVFFLYFIVCYPISKFAGMLENRWAKEGART